jgi:hypothetical protein
MATGPASDLQDFHRFLGERLATGSSHLSPEEALDEWRVLHPTRDELAESVFAVRRAIGDMRAGDRGREVDAILAEVRQRVEQSSKK